MGKLSIRETNVFFLCYIVGYVMLSLVIGMFLPLETPEWLVYIISTAIVLTPAVFLLIIKKINPRDLCGREKVKISDLILAYIGAYCLMPVIYLVNYITMFFARNYVGAVMMDIYEYPLILQLILIAVMPAVAEEFIFRGVFFGSYVKSNPIKAAMMSGFIFGVIHLNINQFAYAFVMGFVFSMLFYASDNILIPMTAHFAINANTVFSINRSNPSEILEASDSAQTLLQEMPGGVLVITGVVVLIMAVLGVFFFGLIINRIAKNHGRKEILKTAFSQWKINNDEDDERFMDIYFLIAAIPAVVYMIMLEMI